MKGVQSELKGAQREQNINLRAKESDKSKVREGRLYYEAVFISKKRFAVHIRLFKSDIKLCTHVIQSLLLVLQLYLFAI